MNYDNVKHLYYMPQDELYEKYQKFKESIENKHKKKNQTLSSSKTQPDLNNELQI